MAFKMKGSPMKMGTIQGTSGHTSALKKEEEKKDNRAWYKKAYDEASQIGQGLKGAVFGRSIQSGRHEQTNPVKEFKHAYNKEERSDHKDAGLKYSTAVRTAKDARKAKRKAGRKATSDENLATRRAKQDARRDGSAKAARKAKRTQKRVDRISGVTKGKKQDAKAFKQSKKEDYSNMTYAQKKAAGGSSYYKD